MLSEQRVDGAVSAASAGVASTRLLACLAAGRGRLWVIGLQGNFGDNLIWLGLEYLLRRQGLDFEVVPFSKLRDFSPSQTDTVYVHGGGGWVPFWSGVPERVLKDLVTRHKGRIVVGPSTFSPDKEYLGSALFAPLSSAADRCFVFCRDQPSFDIVASEVGESVEVILDHDTALNLTRDEVLAFGEPVGPNRGYRLYALRNDAETRPPGACRVLRAPVDPIGYSYSFKHWVRLHARAGSIVTNRLHSAICGSILGVPTTLLPNSYHKARGVWELSLAARGVQWADRLPPDWLGEVEERLGIAGYWRRTPKLRRLVGRWRFGSSR